MKDKLALLYSKYIKPFLTAILVLLAFAAYIGICELYQYLALNVF